LDPDVYANDFLPILNNYDGKSRSINEDDTDATGVVTAASSKEKILLNPFLSSFSNAEAGFQCVSLLLFRFLLLSHDNVNDDKDDGKGDGDTTKKPQTLPNQPKTIVGYDSRVRYAFKYLSVSILKFWDPIYGTSGGTSSALYKSESAGTKYATCKFEALEDAIAYRLSIITKQIIVEGAKQDRDRETAQLSSTTNTTTTVTSKAIKKRNQIVRGMKIGSAAIGAGALMAITGGIALPAIVGGIAAAAGVTALSFGAVAAISLLLLPATVTIFGVGSGVLVASKMNNRTRGLTEFDIRPAVGVGVATAEDKGKKNKKGGHSTKHQPKQQQQQQQQLKLSRTICINGWIADEHDFERPFGMQPHSLTNKSELLKRFCSVFAPQVIPNCDGILKEWKNKESDLWHMLHDAYGRDPSSLYPLDNDNDGDCILTADENRAISMMVGSIMGIEENVMQKVEEEIKSNDTSNRTNRPFTSVSLLEDVLSNINNKNKSSRQLKKSEDGAKGDGDKKYRAYEAWDFQSTYKGMELYTISWEKDLLLQLRGSAIDVTKGLAMKGAEEALKKTIFASFMSAVAVPATMLGLADLIDEKWTLANERADEAGILLAESLLSSSAGHRPINLIGISFGARMIISCLTELSRHQKKWEKQQKQQQQHRKREIPHGRSASKSRPSNLLEVGDEIRLKVGGEIRKSISKLGDIGNKNRDKGVDKSETTTYLREPASIVENIILMGCPATVKESTWKDIRSVAAGRLVNCYSGNDLMLSLMYRIKNPTTALLNPPVGISEVKDCGVANFDVSDLINYDHSEYSLAVRDIMDLVGFDQPGA